MVADWDFFSTWESGTLFPSKYIADGKSQKIFFFFFVIYIYFITSFYDHYIITSCKNELTA